MTFDFVGKRVLITGAGSGIGKAAALMFAASGARVALNSASESARAVVDLLPVGTEAVFVQGDVGDEVDAQRIVATAVEALGGLDVVVNNAGVVTPGRLEDTSLAEWNRVLTTNLTGTFLISKYALPHLRSSRGVIVNNASVAGLKALENRAAYSASKGAVLALSRATALDYARDGVRVNCVSPGTIRTPLVENQIASADSPAAKLAAFEKRQPLGRLGTPEEVARAILFAASDETSFLTDCNIVIDGGAHL